MPDEITNKMLLEHIMAIKTSLEQRIDKLEQSMNHRFEKVDQKFEQVNQQFEDAKLHREAIQEDLEETMRVQQKHGKQLTSLSSR